MFQKVYSVQQTHAVVEGCGTFLHTFNTSVSLQGRWRMFAPGLFFAVSFSLLLGSRSFVRNEAPCQRARSNKGYKTFLQRHLPPGTPTSLDREEWKNYIKSKTGCGRPTQSFLNPKDLDRVREVCTGKGGKAYKENLCISEQAFTFVTVRSESGTCGIKNIREETKHLILACEMLGDDCLPVHFEGNPEDLRPSYTSKACQDPQSKGHAPRLTVTRLWLPLTILTLFLLNFNYVS